MSYITYEQFIEHNTITDTSVTEANFSAFEKQAERCLNNVTMTVDGVKKLIDYFPTAEDDAEAVYCSMTAIINALADFSAYEANVRAAQAGGHSGIIASVSSGSESISYVTNGAFTTAAQTPAGRNAYLYQIAHEYLAGAKDANGVNLLYGGAYPCIRTR